MKTQLREGIIQKALVAIFNAIASGQRQRLMQQLNDDPEFKRLTNDLETLRQKIQAKLEHIRKTDPKWAEQWGENHPQYGSDK